MSPGLLTPRLQQSVVEGGCGKVTAYQHIQFLVVFVVVGERGSYGTLYLHLLPRARRCAGRRPALGRNAGCGGRVEHLPRQGRDGRHRRDKQGMAGQNHRRNGKLHAFARAADELGTSPLRSIFISLLTLPLPSTVRTWKIPTATQPTVLKTCGNMVYYDAFRKAADATYYSHKER